MLRPVIKFTATICLLLFGTVSSAQTIGNWFTELKSATGLYAATINDSGALFGQFCYPAEGNCIWLIGMSTGCDKGDKYPVLANSDAGAQQLELLCDGRLESGLYRYVFLNFDAVDAIARKGTRIGIAIPLQADQFRVVRFQLNGATQAIDVMRAASERRVKPASKTTRDLLL
jgi:hypothetical protein